MLLDAAPVQAQRLPVEIIILILSLQPPPSLARCQQVCRLWNRLAQEERIWQHVATHQQGYVHPRYTSIEQVFASQTSPCHNRLDENSLRISLDNDDDTPARGIDESERTGSTSRMAPLPKSSATDYYSQVDSFQQLCKKKWCLDRAWSTQSEPMGSGIDVTTGDTFSIPCRLTPVMRSLDAAPPFVGAGWDQNDDVIEEVGRDVWRIKIDPQEKTLISTGQRGGVRVVDIVTGEVLWRLDRRMTRHFPHVEFDAGFMIFDRIGHGNFEVWKQSRLENPSARRGTYELYASLESPRPTRALRFQYPILAVATQDGFVLLWDITKQRIVQVISLAHSLHVDANINYIDFDDHFVFLVGVGAKSVSVISRRLGKVIWSLVDHFEAGLESPATYVLAPESEHLPAKYASLERRRLKRSQASPWQKATGTQNFAQLMMTPIESWSAVHPDHRSGTLVILGQTNVLLIRDYVTCFLAWERRTEHETGQGVAGDTLPAQQELSPTLFADLCFGRDPDLEGLDYLPAWDTVPHSQLAVAESRAMCIVRKAMLLDLDPLRQLRNNVRNLDGQERRSTAQVGHLVDDQEAGFAVYDNIRPSSRTSLSGADRGNSTLEACSCVMMDSTSAYAVQLSESAVPEGFERPDIDLAVKATHDVLIWDFGKEASKQW